MVLVTDGTYSYAVLTYNCGLMGWSGSPTIGFTAGSSNYDNYDPSNSDVACLTSPNSNWTNIVYLLSEDSPELPLPSNTLSFCHHFHYDHCIHTQYSHYVFSPDKLELYMLRTTSVNVTWNIPSISETEEYIIEYGFEPDKLNSTSSTLDSVTDTSLQNQSYSLVIDKLDTGTIYYLRVMAQYGFANLFKRYSSTIAFRTLEKGILIFTHHYIFIYLNFIR